MLKNPFFTVFCLCSGVVSTQNVWSQDNAATAAVVIGDSSRSLLTSTTFTNIRSTDAGVSPETVFDAKQKLTTSVTIHVDPAHVGKTAAIFIVARYQSFWFMKNDSNLWVAWNGNPADLVMNKPVQALASSENVVIEQQLTNLPGKFEIYAGYKLDNAYTLNATPFVFTVVTGKLNDTGVFYCANIAQYLNPNQKDVVDNLVPYACPMAGFAGQDGEYGRDATNYDNNDGQAGFSFTKIDSSGKDLPVTATTWSCVRDNVTGLLWEHKTPSTTGINDLTNLINGIDPSTTSVSDLKSKINALKPSSTSIIELKTIINLTESATTSDLITIIKERISAYILHSQDHTYSWNNPDSATNGGTPGLGSAGSCDGSSCDTFAFAKKVNETGLCGHNDGWRLPSKNELLSIVDNTRYTGKLTTVTDPATGTVSRVAALAAIDPIFFPNTPALDFWSASPMANGQNNAWSVYFYYGSIGNNSNKNNLFRVRLVRG